MLFFLAAALAAFAGVQAILYPLLAAGLRLAGARFDASGLLLSGALLLAHWASLRWVDGERGWRAVSLDRGAARPRAIATGLLAGAGAIGVPTALLLAAGWLRLDPAADGSWAGTALSLGAFLLPAALWEELLFRGYAFRAVADGAGEWAALSATSLLFGLIHLSNAGATAQSTALVTLAGFFLGAVLLRTRSLYAAWAAHWAWNWTMAGLFHVAVSGAGFATPDYRVVDAGPDWVTGGVWGPEGGAAAGLGMVGGMFLLLGARSRWAGRGRSSPESGTSRAAPAHGAAGRGGD